MTRHTTAPHAPAPHASTAPHTATAPHAFTAPHAPAPHSGTVGPTNRPPTGVPVSLHRVTRTYGHGDNAVPALDMVSLDVAPGEFVCLVGASGCGKSTLLNLVAGLDRPDSGRIRVGDEQPATTPGLMFQEAALFPWLTVATNVELPLRLRRLPRTERRARVAELLRTVHLADFARKRPHELSGGMRQRVALARTLALDTPVLLMDEPFGALDAMTRDLLHDELERIWQERRLTVLFVTHNVREAARLADRIVLLSSRPGRIIHQRRVDVPRPRRIDSPEIAAVAAEVTDRLRTEVGRHGR